MAEAPTPQNKQKRRFARYGRTDGYRDRTCRGWRTFTVAGRMFSWSGVALRYNLIRMPWAPPQFRYRPDLFGMVGLAGIGIRCVGAERMPSWSDLARLCNLAPDPIGEPVHARREFGVKNRSASVLAP